MTYIENTTLLANTSSECCLMHTAPSGDTLNVADQNSQLATTSLFQNHSKYLLTEYLRLGPHGAIGRTMYDRDEAWPRGEIRFEYQIYYESQFTAPKLSWRRMRWNTALVTFEGVRRRLLWSSDWYGQNVRATMLLEQSDTIFLGHPLGETEVVAGEAYIILNNLSKPAVEIITPINKASDFEKVARPLLGDRWWRAIRIENGWRVYGDDCSKLIFAKLALSE